MVTIQSKEEADVTDELTGKSFQQAMSKRLPLVKRSVDSLSSNFYDSSPTWNDVCDYLEDITVEGHGIKLRDIEMVTKEIMSVYELAFKYSEVLGTLTNILKSINKLNEKLTEDSTLLEPVQSYVVEKFQLLSGEFRELDAYLDRFLKIQADVCQHLLLQKKKNETKQASVSSD